MHTFVKVTAVIILVVGVLMMLVGFGAGVAGLFRSGVGLTTAGGFGRMPFRQGLSAAPAIFPGLNLLVGLIIFVQGLMLAALGEGLYLIANIARNTAQRFSPPAPVPPASAASAASTPQATAS